MCIQSSMPGQHPPSGFLQSGQRNSFPRVPRRPSLCVTVCLSRKLQVKGTEGKWDNKSHCHVKFELCVLDKDNQASKGFQVNKGRLFRLIFLLLSGLSSLLCFLFLSERWIDGPGSWGWDQKVGCHPHPGLLTAKGGGLHSDQGTVALHKGHFNVTPEQPQSWQALSWEHKHPSSKTASQLGAHSLPSCSFKMEKTPAETHSGRHIVLDR